MELLVILNIRHIYYNSGMVILIYVTVMNKIQENIFRVGYPPY